MGQLSCRQLPRGGGNSSEGIVQGKESGGKCLEGISQGVTARKEIVSYSEGNFRIPRFM